MVYVTGIVIVGILTYGFYSFCELFVRRKERMAVIEKISNGEFKSLPDLNRLPMLGRGAYNFSALSIGCLFVGIGIGLVIACLIDIMAYDYAAISDMSERRVIFDILYPALSVTFGGVGLVTSFLIEKRQIKKGDVESSNR